MGKDLQFRITKTEYEQILTGLLVTNFMQAYSGQSKAREQEFLHNILVLGMVNGMDDLVMRKEDGLLTITEKVLKKLNKIIGAYRDEVLSEELEDDK